MPRVRQSGNLLFPQRRPGRDARLGQSRAPPPAVRAYLAVIAAESRITAEAYRKSRAA